MKNPRPNNKGGSTSVLNTHAGTGVSVSQTQNEFMSKASSSWLARAYIASCGILILGAVGCVLAVRDPASDPINTASLVFVAIGTIGVSVLGWILSMRTSREIAQYGAAAATATQLAAQAKLEAAQLRAIAAWRRLGAEQVRILREAIQHIPAEHRIQVWIQFVSPDPEVQIYQQDIRDVFASVGIETAYYSGWEQALGLKISNCQTPMGSAISAAFEQARVPFRALHGDIPRAPGPGTIQILVGSRPPPPGSNVNI